MDSLSRGWISPLIIVVFAASIISACLEPSSELRGQAIITLDSNTTYQTITGWEAGAEAGQESPGFENYKEKVFDLAVNDLGINRVRISVRSGIEHARDNWADFRAGRINKATWRCMRYSTINDNSSPYLY
jgi:hypothetical protein